VAGGRQASPNPKLKHNYVAAAMDFVNLLGPAYMLSAIRIGRRDRFVAYWLLAMTVLFVMLVS
jgi:hypothetical protein